MPSDSVCNHAQTTVKSCQQCHVAAECCQSMAQCVCAALGAAHHVISVNLLVHREHIAALQSHHHLCIGRTLVTVQLRVREIGTGSPCMIGLAGVSRGICTAARGRSACPALLATVGRLQADCVVCYASSQSCLLASCRYRAHGLSLTVSKASEA